MAVHIGIEKQRLAFCPGYGKSLAARGASSCRADLFSPAAIQQLKLGTPIQGGTHTWGANPGALAHCCHLHIYLGATLDPVAPLDFNIKLRRYSSFSERRYEVPPFSCYNTDLAIGLSTDNFHPVPLLLRCTLHQLVWAKHTDPVQVGAALALRRRHERGRDQEDLGQTGKSLC